MTKVKKRDMRINSLKKVEQQQCELHKLLLQCKHMHGVLFSVAPHELCRSATNK
jgi:hypothetical protein